MSNLSRIWDSELFLLRAGSRGELTQQGIELRRRLAVAEDLASRDLAYTLSCALEREAPMCLAIVANSLQDLDHKLEHALKRLADPTTHRIKERSGIYFFDAPLGRTGGLAFLFPGEGSQYRNMLADLCVHFPEVREWFDLIDRAFVNHPRQYLPSQVIFSSGAQTAEDEARLWQMDCGTEAIFAANQGLFALLRSLEIRPQAVLGHSTGEYSALYASGATHIEDRERLIRLIRSLNDVYEQFRQRRQIPEGELCAVSAPDREQVLRIVDQSGGRLFVAMDNCPHQIVLYAAAQDMEKAKSQLVAAGSLCNPLPFNRAYHTPLFAPFAEAVAGFVAQLNLKEPEIEIYSALTGQPYPKIPEEMRRIASDYWMRPVRFTKTVEAMYSAGIRIFVEVGARGNLSAFVDDILRGRPYAAIPANVISRSGIEQLNHLLALLAANGVPMNLTNLFARRSPRQVTLQEISTPANVAEVDRPIRVLSSLPLLQLAPDRQARVAQPTPVAAASSPKATSPSRSVAMSKYLETMQKFLEVNETVVKVVIDQRRRVAPAAPNGPSHAFPFIGRILSLTPGRSLTAVRVLSLDDDVFLRDHVLGGPVSSWDEELRALPVVPLTMSMEMLAEAAAALLPDKQVVGLKDVRAHRWLALPDGSLPLRLTAQVGNSWREVAAQITVEGQERGTGGQSDSPALEGTVVLDDAEPAAIAASEGSMAPLRSSRWSSGDLYSKGMFHGPRFQGVASIDRCSEDGAEATLRILPSDSLFRSDSSPRLLTDPILLDAAGQVIGYWAMETCERAYNVFPFRVEAVELHRSRQRVGDFATCRAHIKVDDSVIRSDIEVAAADGQRLARLAGWEDRRFDLPESLFRLRVSPRDQLLATPWSSPIDSLPNGQAFICCRVADLSPELLRGHGRIWEQVLAHLVLSRRERNEWRGLATAVERRRNHWLLGRCAAKDAVRSLVRARHGLQLYAADVEIDHDVNGHPQAGGSWSAQIGSVPLVSISHIDGLAVAIATDGPYAGIGIDVEWVTDHREDLPQVAFTAPEREWVRALDDSVAEEWVLRFWCAKEAVLKALGRGLAGGPRAAVIKDVNMEAGTMTVAVSDEQEPPPRGAAGHLMAYTAREGDLVFATSAYEGN